MTEAALVERLDEIKAEICIAKSALADFGINGNTVFLSLDSFYDYIDGLMQKRVSTHSRLPELLTEIDDYISIPLSDEQLAVFINDVVKADDARLDKIEKYLDKLTKIGFINQVFDACVGATEWDALVVRCKAVRGMKEAAVDE